MQFKVRVYVALSSSLKAGQPGLFSMEKNSQEKANADQGRIKMNPPSQLPLFLLTFYCHPIFMYWLLLSHIHCSKILPIAQWIYIYTLPSLPVFV